MQRLAIFYPYTMMTRFFLSFILLCLFPGSAFAFHPDVEYYLCRLDSILEESESYVQEKENKISALRQKQSPLLQPEEQLWLNRLLYDEYYVYNADSAMIYVNDNIRIARRLQRKDWEQEWQLNKVFVLSAAGLLVEAQKYLEQIDFDELDDRLKFDYYDRHIYLYSHLGQYIGSGLGLADSYFAKEGMLKNEAKNYITPDNPSYASFYGSLYTNLPPSSERDSVKQHLKHLVDQSSLSTRTDAINAYILAILYKGENDEDNYIKYLALSSFVDVKICNRDIAALEELSFVMSHHQDIDRGYAYINYCLKMALLYPNRVRVMNISSILDKLQAAYQQRNGRQEQQLRYYLYTTSFLTLVLLLTVILIYVQFRRISKSRKKLDNSNKLLNQHIHELSEAQDMLAQVNGELNTVNDQLKTRNSQLREANYVKEEYIGYVFSICSNYIGKFEDYRKNINRKLKAGQYNEIKELTSRTTLAQKELKEFYHSFDAVFLHVYPDFVEDFNSLLRPEERITLKEGELLNTELRIYALVRLGINDSVKIAEFLHCSPQTVYNNRLNARNKAIIPKEKFAETVRSLGKMQK